MSKRQTIVTFTIFIILCFTMIALAKYISKAYGSDDGRVAKYILNENIDTISLDLGMLNQNNSYDYEFIISNTKDDDVSEVVQKYKLIFDTSNNIPLKITLYKNDEEITLTDNETEYQVLKSKQEDSYKVHLQLDNSTYEDSDLVDYLDINIVASQVD